MLVKDENGIREATQEELTIMREITNRTLSEVQILKKKLIDKGVLKETDFLVE